MITRLTSKGACEHAKSVSTSSNSATLCVVASATASRCYHMLHRLVVASTKNTPLRSKEATNVA